jgi:hypothetical protein
MLKTPQNSRDDRSFRRWFSPCARNSACTAEMGLGCKDVTLAGGECGEGGIRAAAMHILRAAAQRLPGARPCACLLVRPSPHCIARRRLRANHACVSFASLCLHPIPVSQRIGYERPRARNGVCAGFAPQLCTSCALRHSALLALDPVLEVLVHTPSPPFQSGPRFSCSRPHASIRRSHHLQPEARFTANVDMSGRALATARARLKRASGCKDVTFSRRGNAEREGFEPSVSCDTTVFETAPIGHSGTSPVAR